uniref:Uncharacterized protein n=1 Tax=Leviviridae sp. TaxID=2027243 RepID=A0A514DBT4_9VIRU|nr:MAG: hypothetical protein H2RhizoLitter491712_000002 [Leviviridae sp.]
MLQDPLVLFGISTFSAADSTSPFGTARIVSVGDRKTVRRGRIGDSPSGDPFTLTLQNTDSSENAPAGSTRTNVRLDVDKESTDLEKSVRTTVSVTIVQPRTTDGSLADVSALLAAVVHLLVMSNANAVGSSELTSPSDLGPRIVLGEP